jgi:hypothetical protein
VPSVSSSKLDLFKLDLFKLHQADYAAPRKKPVLLTPAPGQYLRVEGCGEPGGPVFEARLGALYAVAFTIKMTRKFDGHGDYVVGKLEARYPGLPVDGSELPPLAEWRWEMLIRTPEAVGAEDLAAALSALTRRGKAGDAAEVGLRSLDEGPCVQMLHLGPYEAEGRTTELMRAHADAAGWRFRGPLHEVHLSDPRRVAPGKLKTILRVPVEAKESG